MGDINIFNASPEAFESGLAKYAEFVRRYHAVAGGATVLSVSSAASASSAICACVPGTVGTLSTAATLSTNG